MERRKQPRFDVVHAVQVTVLDEPPVKLKGQVVNVSGGGFRLLAEGQIRLNAAVRIDMSDAVLLAEVCYCREDDSGLYAIGLESQQILSHTSDFAQLMNSLSGYSDRPAVAPDDNRGVMARLESKKSHHAILADG